MFRRRKPSTQHQPQPAAWWNSHWGRVMLIPLRDLNPQQWRALTALYGDYELARLNAAEPSGIPHWLLRLMLLSDASKQRAAFGVVLHGQLIGNAELYDFAPTQAPTRATLGVMLAREYWGKGLGTAALQALLAYAFGHTQATHSPLRLERVRLSTLQTNGRAQRAFQRVGFRETGRGILNGQAMLDMEVQREVWLANLANLPTAALPDTPSDTPPDTL